MVIVIFSTTENHHRLDSNERKFNLSRSFKQHNLIWLLYTNQCKILNTNEIWTFCHWNFVLFFLVVTTIFATLLNSPSFITLPKLNSITEFIVINHFHKFFIFWKYCLFVFLCRLLFRHCKVVHHPDHDYIYTSEWKNKTHKAITLNWPANVKHSNIIVIQWIRIKLAIYAE